MRKKFSETKSMRTPFKNICTEDIFYLPAAGAADAEIKVPSVENTSLKVFPLKPGEGQYLAMHAALTARNFFLASFYPSGPFICIFFPKPFPSFSSASCV